MALTTQWVHHLGDPLGKEPKTHHERYSIAFAFYRRSREGVPSDIESGAEIPVSAPRNGDAEVLNAEIAPLSIGWCMSDPKYFWTEVRMLILPRSSLHPH
jgi:hypothetical protein